MIIFCLFLTIEVGQAEEVDLNGGAGPAVNKDLLYDRLYNRQIFKEAYEITLQEESRVLAQLGGQQKIIDTFSRIKFSILNGNLERAKVELLKFRSKDNYIVSLRARYLAVIYFIENNFKLSLESLSIKELYNTKSFTKICLLKTINMIILDHKDLYETWIECKRLTFQHEKTEAMWIENLVLMRSNKLNYIGKSKIKNLKALGFDSKYIKLYLKMALYMNYEESILNYIEKLPEEFFNDDEIRELMGHLFYRNGKLGEAFDFLEDIQTVNAENIKGNIYLADKKYELAYAQFKLALRKKSDSYNALERSIPLAWLLNQYNDGIDFTNRLYKTESNKYKKMALITVFYLKTGKYEEAIKLLEEITLYAKYSQPFEINQLYSYAALMNEDLTKTKIYADLSCKKLDPIACWTLYQTSIWEDFSKTIKRPEQINYESVALLDDLMVNKYDAAIDENVIIDQRDIEELDDQLIQISTPKD